jgi:hypothetical protein
MSSLNPRLLIVGHAPRIRPRPLRERLYSGGTADFDKIQDAIDAIGSDKRYPPATGNRRYTIFVTPGIYREKITFKSSFVDLVGVSQHSVYIQPDTTRRDKAIIHLVSDVTLSNVTIWNEHNQYAIFGHDVRYAGLNRVEVWARFISKGELSTAKALRMDGNWSVFITRFFGASYYGTDGYAVELVGPNPRTPDTIDTKADAFTPNGWNADCHLINSFFDSLSIGEGSTGGCVYVRDCHEVHLRNSLARTTGGGAAVRIEATNPGSTRKAYPRAEPYMGVGTKTPLVAVTLEGSTLNGPRRALSIGDSCLCFFRHSAADSIDVEKRVDRVWRGRLLDPGWRETRAQLELG